MQLKIMKTKKIHNGINRKGCVKKIKAYSKIKILIYKKLFSQLKQFD